MPQHNETILSIKYCKFAREQNENAEEWTVYLRIQANEYRYKEKERRLKEQFINSIYDDMMTDIK